MTDPFAYERRPISDPSWCCHGCGYQLEGLLPRQRCPECGTQCGYLPGTAWQHYADRKGYVDFALAALRRPLKTMRSVRPDPWGYRSQQLLWGQAVAALVLVTSWPTFLSAIFPRSANGLIRSWLPVVGFAAAVMVGCWWLVGAMARVSRLPALVVPLRGHAALGWPIGAVLAAAATLTGVLWFEVRAERAMPMPWAAGLPAASVLAGATISVFLALLGLLRSRPAAGTPAGDLADRVRLDRTRRERRTRAFERMARREGG